MNVYGAGAAKCSPELDKLGIQVVTLAGIATTTSIMRQALYHCTTYIMWNLVTILPLDHPDKYLNLS
jgi:hypothetical protein